MKSGFVKGTFMLQKLSVLISVYHKDNPTWFREALNSIFTQTTKPSEIVVVCDGPVGKDIQAVLDEVSKDKIVRILSCPVDMGRGAALAYAVPKCNCDLIALMDADDVSRKDRFEKQLAAFAANPNLSVCGGQIQEVDAENFTPLSKRIVPLTHQEICQYLKTRMPFNNVTVMFKKADILEAGNYKPFGTLEDYYMWARVIAKGKQVQNVPDILVDVRIGQGMYNRRSGWNYFKMNKLLFDELKKLGLLSSKDYYYTLFVRFCVQVLMPNSVRGFFYRKVLR